MATLVGSGFTLSITKILFLDITSILRLSFPSRRLPEVSRTKSFHDHVPWENTKDLCLSFLCQDPKDPSDGVSGSSYSDISQSLGLGISKF